MWAYARQNVKHDSQHNSQNLLFDHKPRSVFVAEPHNSKDYSFFGYTFLAACNVRVFLHSRRQRRWECFSSSATLTTRRTAESYTVPSDFDKQSSDVACEQAPKEIDHRLRRKTTKGTIHYENDTKKESS